MTHMTWIVVGADGTQVNNHLVSLCKLIAGILEILLFSLRRSWAFVSLIRQNTDQLKRLHTSRMGLPNLAALGVCSESS